MAKFRVCFDGKWQGTFDNREDACEWAEAVGETGRLVHVAKSGLFGTNLVAVFPESRTSEGERVWRVRAFGAGVGGG